MLGNAWAIAELRVGEESAGAGGRQDSPTEGKSAVLLE